MANPKVEIEVELSGAKEVESDLSGVGEATASVANAMGSTNEKLGEGLSGISDSVGVLKEGFGGLKGAVGALGTTGSAGLMGMIGPLAAVTMGAMALYEAFKMVTGAAQLAEERKTAIAAAAGDLQSKLEALAEKGVVLTAKAMREFARADIMAQLEKEKLQTATEKVTGGLKEYWAAVDEGQRLTKEHAKAVKGLAQAEEVMRSAWNEDADTIRGAFDARFKLKAIIDQQAASVIRLKKAETAYYKQLDKSEPFQRKNMEHLKKVEELYVSHEETSVDARKTKAAELIDRVKNLKLMDAEGIMSEDRLSVEKAKIETTELASKALVRKHSEDKKRLGEIVANLEKEVKAFDEAEVVKQLAFARTARAEKALRDKQGAARSQRASQAEARKTKRQAEALKAIAEEARIQQLRIELTKEGDAKLVALANLQRDTAKKMNKKNKRALETAELQHQLTMFQIGEAAKSKEAAADKNRVKRELTAQLNQEQRQLEAKRFANDQSNTFMRSSFADVLAMTDEAYKREEELLISKHRKEEMLARQSGDNVTEMMKRQEHERGSLLAKSMDKRMDAVGEFSDKYGSAFVEAGVGALFFGESFKEATGAILAGLARQAAVQALMETAKGVAALTNPITAPTAGGHFQSAAMFAGAATAAGLGARALGYGGGGGGGAGGASPSGAPQTAPTPQREEATSDAMVFNINFGGAVIYDTKRAAEQALADRIANIMNTPRRGAVRLNRG